MVKISGVIITYNEERNIARCIDSLKPIADEIVVVDSFSKDKTKEICLAMGVRFVEHHFRTHIEQKNFALTQAVHQHILSLDADEYLSDELSKSILEVKNKWPSEIYRMNRLSSYGGKWIRHGSWYPDRKIRLWNKAYGIWGGENPHDRVVLSRESRIFQLKGDILHQAYKDAKQTLDKIQRYSDIFASENIRRRSSSILKILGHATFAFSKSYFIKRGILDGFEGLMVAKAEANHAFYKYSRLYEVNRNIRASLIITTYNRPDALELVLISVLKQEVLPDEVIVADDGSGEETRNLIERYQNTFPVPLVHCWQEDIGFRLSAIRNRAIELCKEDYIIMIDGDIVLPPRFVIDHKDHAWKRQFIQGSRVLLLEKKTMEMLSSKRISVDFFDRGIDNRFNSIQSKWLTKLFSYYRTGHRHVRGANFSFWRDDILFVNGFNEDFAGWGREDSDFAVRMNNAGIRRKHLKFAGFGFHLYHKAYSRKQLPINDAILARTIENKLIRCENGITKALTGQA